MIGLPAVRALLRDIVPVLDIIFVDAAVHTAAAASLLAANRRRLSLVDCASFEVMRRADIRQAFAFDPHFAGQGFTESRGIA
jgi:predicted nucleic acid-binding protein